MLQQTSKIFQNILSRGFRPSGAHAVDRVCRTAMSLHHNSDYNQKLKRIVTGWASRSPDLPIAARDPAF